MSIEVRRDDDGTIDEIVARSADVHFEMLDHDEACLTVNDHTFYLHAAGKGAWKLKSALSVKCIDPPDAAD